MKFYIMSKGWFADGMWRWVRDRRYAFCFEHNLEWARLHAMHLQQTQPNHNDAQPVGFFDD